MPIVPRYEIPDRDIPTVQYPAAPADMTVSNVLKAVSGAALDFAKLAATRRAAEDATELAKRTMMAETDIDDTVDSIRQNRDLHKTAPDEYRTTIQRLQEKWTKGLRQDQAAVLVKNMTPRVIAGLKSTREIKNTYLIDDATSTLNATEQTMIDKAGRLDQTDTQAFQPMFTTQTIEGGPFGTGEPGDQVMKRLNGAFPEYIRALVRSNLLSETEGDKRIRDALDAMAYRRLQRMSISENPAVVQQAIDLLDAEEGERGSTFASVLRPEHRNALRAAAQGQRETLRHRAQEDADRADRLSRQRQKDIDDETKARDHGEITNLTLGVLKGDRGFEDLSRVLIYNNALRGDPVRTEHLYNLIENRGKSGGTTNWELYNQIWAEVQRSRGAANIVDRVLPYVGKQNGIAREDAEKLITAGKTAAENSIFKDDFYQAGQRDIDRALQNPAGIVDKAQQQRWAEASRMFFDRATPLIQSGQRERIPQLAREISDQFRFSAPNVTAVPQRSVTRYPTIEDTVNSFISENGMPERWTPATTREFNRQIWLHEQLPKKRPEEQPAAGTKPPKKSQQPNPIPQ